VVSTLLILFLEIELYNLCNKVTSVPSRLTSKLQYTPPLLLKTECIKTNWNALFFKCVLYKHAHFIGSNIHSVQMLIFTAGQLKLICFSYLV
jgi:hypothetical protein